VELPTRIVVLVRSPDGVVRTIDGRSIALPRIAAAFDSPAPYVRLDRTEAPLLGLPARTAVLGLARIDDGRSGKWGIGVAATAEHMRDRERWAQWRSVLTVATAGVLVLVFGGMALRTQRHELVAAHEIALAKLETAQEERLQRAARSATLGTLAIGVAHEISTPLGVIAGRAEQLLLHVRHDEKASEAARIVIAQADGIGHIIKALLHMARGAAPRFTPVDADAVMRGAANMTSHKFAAARVRLQVVPCPREVVVMGDQQLLEHALINLLLNACDASRPGYKVTAEVWALDKEVCFSVADEGPGISDEAARRALEPFFTTKADEGGTGLGLAIAQEIVVSHRGTLRLRQRQPRGTSAIISLPASDGHT
jgi:signal transduction histidine kinase